MVKEISRLLYDPCTVESIIFPQDILWTMLHEFIRQPDPFDKDVLWTHIIKKLQYGPAKAALP